MAAAHRPPRSPRSQQHRLQGEPAATLRSLGLRKIRQTVERADTPQIRGMIHTVRHLVTVEEVDSS